MGTTVWFGEDGGLAEAVGAVRVAVDPAALRGASLAVAPAALFGELVAHSRGMVPIVVVEPGGAARARLLDAGAADVVPSAIEPVELAARLRAVRRRSAGRLIAVGDLLVDLVDRRAMRAGVQLSLHPREFAVLACLARRAGRPVSRAQIYEQVWLRRFDPGTNVVAVAVSRLRARVDAGRGAALIATVPGGYRLGPAAVTPAAT